MRYWVAQELTGNRPVLAIIAEWQASAIACERMDARVRPQVGKQVVGVIGGRGAFGQWCVQLFEAHGHPVQISDINTPLSNAELIRSSAIVVVAVPIGATAAVLREVSEHVGASALVVDLTSVKTPFVDLLSRIPTEVLSLHPMFSPRLRDPRGQVCVACGPIGVTGGSKYVEELLVDVGLDIVRMTYDEHDRTMAVVQGLTHLQSLAAAHCLAALGFDPGASLAVASPVYQIRMAMIGRVVAQDPRLYAEIEMFNPYVKAVLKQLESSQKRLTTLIEQCDVAQFADEISAVRTAFGPFCDLALKESDAMIEGVRQRQSRAVVDDSSS